MAEENVQAEYVVDDLINDIASLTREKVILKARVRGLEEVNEKQENLIKEYEEKENATK